MNALIYDCESTGLSLATDRIIEYGLVVVDTKTMSPLYVANMFPYDNYEIPQEIVELTGITKDFLVRHGQPPADCLLEIKAIMKLYDIKYIVAHNGTNFDFPMLYFELNRYNIPHPEFHPIDTRTDIPFKKEPRSRDLASLCFSHGIAGISGHRSVFDCISVMQLLSHYDFDKVLELSYIPTIVVRAMVSYEDRELAKKAGFSWERLGPETFPKQWVRNIKENKLEDFKKSCSFPITVLS